MNEPLIHRFPGCELRAYPSTRYVETVFRDASKAPATRDSTMQNLEYAQHLGYEDTWAALLEHEIGHTLISMRLGFPYSPTLFAVAHDYAPGTAPYEEQLYEEALVLAVQRFSRTGEVLPILKHPEIRPHYSLWARQIRAIAGELMGPATEVAA